MKEQNKREQELIDEAINAGKLRRFPMGTTSDWDGMSFRKRRSLMLNKSKGRKT